MNEYILAFLTGLTAGGISCLALQGGLLAGTIDREAGKKTGIIQTLLFLLARLAVYTFLGFMLGAVGSKLIPSISVQAYIQLFIGLVLLCVAGNLLNLHPLFRIFSFKPPKKILRLSKTTGKNPGYVSSSVVGALTVFIPCGVTQAMMLVAITSGSATESALILFFFILGSSPLFFVLGASYANLIKNKMFSYIAVIIIVYFALVSINGSMVLLNSPHTFGNYVKVLRMSLFDLEDNNSTNAKINKEGIQEATIFVSSRDYKSDVSVLKKDVPVRLTIVTNKTYGCARAFVIPSLGINKILPETGVETIEFTPTVEGSLTYSCSMGMYYNKFEVI